MSPLLRLRTGATMMQSSEEQINQAMQDGKFDHLPGKGRPLHLEENPFEDAEWRVSHHILRSSGYTLPWIETRRELQDALQSACAALRRTWEWSQNALAESQPSGFVQDVWKYAAGTFRQRVEEYNRRLLAYNLQAPSDRFHLPPLEVDREIERITAIPTD